MTSTARPPLQIGPLISSALAKVWHFKLEVGILWFGLAVSAFVVLPFSPPFENQILAMLGSGGSVPDTPTDNGAALRLLVVSLIVGLFEAGLMVLWLRVLRLGTVLALEGGVRMLVVRSVGLFLRCLALLMVFVGGLIMFAVVLRMILRGVLGPGAAIEVSLSDLALFGLLLLILLVALAIRMSFALIAPVFDTPVPIERAWSLLAGNTLRLLGAVIMVCFPVMFVGSLLSSSIVRLIPPVADAAATAATSPGIGILIALTLVRSVTTTLELAVTTALVMEAFEQLGGWGKGRIVSEVA